MKADIKTTTTLSIPEPNLIPIGGRKSVTPKQVLMLVADINYTTIHLFNGEQFIIATTLNNNFKTNSNRIFDDFHNFRFNPWEAFQIICINTIPNF